MKNEGLARMLIKEIIFGVELDDTAQLLFVNRLFPLMRAKGKESSTKGRSTRESPPVRSCVMASPPTEHTFVKKI